MIDRPMLERAVDRAAVRYDRAGDQHYDVISAFIKSIRGSDADAALHYLARMIEAGEDPRFIARRLVVHASEDVGMADPTALQAAVAAAQAVEFVGLPEARINLAQAVIHLALAPKSNAVVRAINAALADVRAGLAGPVPAHLRDASYRGAARLGHGKGYLYPHDDPEGVVAQQYAPDAGRRASSTTSRPGTGRGQVRRAVRADQGDLGRTAAAATAADDRPGRSRRRLTDRDDRLALRTETGRTCVGSARVTAIGSGARACDRATGGAAEGAADERRAAGGADRGRVLRRAACAPGYSC